MVSREYAGSSGAGRALCAMGLACALAGTLLGGIPAEKPGIALGAMGYGLATRSGDRAGQVLSVLVVALCVLSMAIPSPDLPGLFLES